MPAHKIIHIAISLLLCCSIGITALFVTPETDAGTDVYETEAAIEASAETTAKAVTETAAETVPETSPEAAPETVPETSPETAAPQDVYTESSAAPSVFDSSLFIGDSRTLGLSQYASLGRAAVFCSVGMNVFRVFRDTVSVPGFGCTTLDNLLSVRQFDKIYIMLGLNEIGYDCSYITKKYGEALSRIEQAQPSAKIYIQANLRIVKSRSDSDCIYNNAAVNALNSALGAYSDGARVFYIDENPLFDDGEGNLSAEYCVDDFHLKGEFYRQWGLWLTDNAG